jgi:predicted RNA-binding Zn ribbon-like protein
VAASPSGAPGGLETIRRFVNTRNIEAGTDTIAAPRQLTAWLRETGLLPAPAEATPTQLRRTIILRETLRAALAANHAGHPIPADTLTVLNDLAERAHITLAITADTGWVAQPRAEGIDRALGALVVLVADAITDGTWQRLKACRQETCRWAFYDHSRARSGKWCSMRLCGNRAKQQAWRTRRQPDTNPQEPTRNT